jgi:hypothetical protein
MHYNADIVYPVPNHQTQPIVSTVTKEKTDGRFYY